MRTWLLISVAPVAVILTWSIGFGPKSPTPGDLSTAATRPLVIEDPRLVDSLVPPIKLDGFALSGDGGRPLGHHIEPGQGGLISVLDFDFTSGQRAEFHAHGEKVCASGCAASSHPTEKLTEEVFRRLLSQYAHDPIDETSLALETLLYYGRQSQAMLRQLGGQPLDTLREEVLRKELTRQHAKVQIRVVDEEGEVRSSLPATRVPLDRRHVFSMKVNRVQPLVTSGTVKRVGLYHLWTRL
jgi:hypothetical protein